MANTKGWFQSITTDPQAKMPNFIAQEIITIIKKNWQPVIVLASIDSFAHYNNWSKKKKKSVSIIE